MRKKKQPVNNFFAPTIPCAIVVRCKTCERLEYFLCLEENNIELQCNLCDDKNFEITDWFSLKESKVDEPNVPCSI